MHEDLNVDGLMVVRGIDWPQKHVEHFCKANDGGTASPNNALLLPYDLKENRMQVQLEVAYSGLRGQGALYTVDEYVKPQIAHSAKRLIYVSERRASQPLEIL